MNPSKLQEIFQQYQTTLSLREKCAELHIPSVQNVEPNHLLLKCICRLINTIYPTRNVSEDEVSALIREAIEDKGKITKDSKLKHNELEIFGYSDDASSSVKCMIRIHFLVRM